MQVNDIRLKLEININSWISNIDIIESTITYSQFNNILVRCSAVKRRTLTLSYWKYILKNYKVQWVIKPTLAVKISIDFTTWQSIWCRLINIIVLTVMAIFRWNRFPCPSIGCVPRPVTAFTRPRVWRNGDGPLGNPPPIRRQLHRRYAIVQRTLKIQWPLGLVALYHWLLVDSITPGCSPKFRKIVTPGSNTNIPLFVLKQIKKNFYFP